MSRPKRATRFVRGGALGAATVATVAILASGASGGAEVALRPDTATVTVRVRDHLRPGTAGSYAWGRVTSAPAGIDCPGDCAAEFPRGSKVTLSVRPTDGYALTEWRVDGLTCSDPPTCLVAVDRDTVVEAGMEPAAKLIAAVDGAGKIAFDPVERGQPARTCSDSVTVRRACVQRHLPGTRVTVRALADETVAGAHFLGWSHPDCPGRRRTCTITLQPGALSLWANFAPVLLTIVEGAWPFVLDPPSTRCRFKVDPHTPGDARTCVVPYPPDAVVTLTPRGPVAPGRWIGNCKDEFARTCVVQMYEDRFVVAGWLYPPWRPGGSTWAGGSSTDGTRIEYAGPPGGTIEIRSLSTYLRHTPCRRSCTALIEHGELVLLRAKPGPGVRFVRWAGRRSRSGTWRLRAGTRSPIRAIFRRR